MPSGSKSGALRARQRGVSPNQNATQESAPTMRIDAVAQNIGNTVTGSLLREQASEIAEGVTSAAREKRSPFKPAI